MARGKQVNVSSRRIIGDLKRDGWIEVNRAGSHVQFKHPAKPGRVTLPHPNRTMNIKTLRSIEKASGLRWT